MKLSKILISTAIISMSSNAFADFGSVQYANPLTVNRIYQGTGATYVTYSGATLSGCSNNGGYLQPTWSTANGGAVNDAAANRMLSILLSSKAIGTTMEVRYKVNDVGTGWDKCAITGIYLH
ncbi:MAG: hypothetical protein GY951_17365 [Psychromonas sp.]|nr:hypothetical protein [Psychromonas sp.]